MSDQNNTPPDAPAMPSGPGAVSEEDTRAQSTPIHNLVGAVVMGAIAILAIILSIGMHNPSDGILTAPGLLPLIVGITLLAMAAGLARNALRRGGAVELRAWLDAGSSRFAIGREGRRTLVLIALVAAYVEALDYAFFEWRVAFADTRLQWGSFEAFSTLFLALVLRVFWRGPWVYCLAVGLAFSTAIAAIFRYGFNIPVPGSG